MPRHASYVARPARLPYKPSAILDLPYRLMNPPPAPCKTNTFQISPDYKIELDDILENKHLPPLALKDFEEYLFFSEYSAENLYFMMWLRDYTDLYQQSVSASESTSSGELAIRFSRALSTFFDSNSNLALNLPSSLTAAIQSIAKDNSHPDPCVFEQTKQQVRDMLKDSLMRFVRICFGNAGRNRSWFSALLGIATVALGFVPVIASLAIGTSRWIRLSGFILVAAGLSAIIASLHGLCLIVYSFGDARQLHLYELAAPQIPKTAISVALDVPRNDDYDDEERKVGGGISTSAFSDDGSGMHATTTDLLTASFITVPSEYTGAPSTTVAGSASAYKFDFDSLPPTPEEWDSKRGSRSSQASLMSSPTFGSITRVSNTVVQRSHWEVAIKSLIIGHILAFLIIVAVVAVPYPHRR